MRQFDLLIFFKKKNKTYLHLFTLGQRLITRCNGSLDKQIIISEFDSH